MRLLLVRHGQTPSNLQHLLDTAEPGPGLTPLGRQQAAALPQALAQERIDALYASTLTRTRLTATPLADARSLEIQVRPGLREIRAGDLEMRSDDAAIDTYLTTTFAWAAGDTALRMPGGESGDEFLARFDGVVAEAAVSGAPAVAMVSHGAAIRTWVAARADNVSVEFASGHALGNTGIVVLDGSPAQGWQALVWEGHPIGPDAGSPQDSGPAGVPVDGS